jgi:uncharacterized protein (TIGR02145 family)
MTLGFTEVGIRAVFWSGDNQLCKLSGMDTKLQFTGKDDSEGASIRCMKDEDTGNAKLPELTTKEASDIMQTFAISGGNILSDGGSAITCMGVCWSTYPNPNLSNLYTVDNYDTGLFFSSQMAPLTPNMKYYVRSYATNAKGTAYGNEVTFTTSSYDFGSVSDIEGNVYQTIQIGNQTWMAENLKTTRYNNGDLIYTGQMAYHRDESNVPVYGRLYTWHAVSDSRNVCPSEWHIPGDAEWDTLAAFLGGPELAGGKMKTTGVGRWWPENAGATDESGFSGLPGGYYSDWDFLFMGSAGYWWSSTETDLSDASFRGLSYSDGNLHRYRDKKSFALSIRCLKD